MASRVVGKSRLGWEFEKYVDGLNYLVRWHSGRCLSYGEGVAFFALAEAIRSRLQRLADSDTDGELEPAELLAAGLEAFVPDPAERSWLGPRLGALLGTQAVGSYQREDLFAAWATFLHRVSEDHTPVVLVIDDAQYADDGLLTFLEYLLEVGVVPVPGGAVHPAGAAGGASRTGHEPTRNGAAPRDAPGVRHGHPVGRTGRRPAGGRARLTGHASRGRFRSSRSRRCAP